MNSQKKSIYRKDFFEAQAGTKDGEILIPANLNLNVFSATCVLITIAILVFIIRGEYTRKVQLEGVVMPSAGIVKVTANSDGQILRVFAKEGDSVKAGDKLYLVSGETYGALGKGMLSSMSESLSKQTHMLEKQYRQEKMLFNVKYEALKEKEAQLLSEKNSSQVALQLALNQVELMSLAEKRYATLARKQFVSEIDFQQKQIEVAIAKEKVEDQRLSLQRLDRELSTSRNDLKKIVLEEHARKLELDRQQQELKQQQIELLTRGKTIVNAPVDGTIAAVLSKSGQRVDNRTLMLTLVPTDATLQVELYAPSRAVGFIRLGQNVGLKFAPFPYEKFGLQHGVVTKVSRASLTPNDMVSTIPISLNKDETYYRIIVNLDKASVTAYGKEEPLLVGMTVEADVDLDTRYLYEWLFEPLWSLKGKL